MYLIAGLLLSVVSAFFAVKGLKAVHPRGGEDARALLSAAYIAAVVIVSSLVFITTDDRLVVSVVGVHMCILVMSVLTVVSAVLYAVRAGSRTSRAPVLFVAGVCALVVGIMCYRQYMPFINGTALLTVVVSCAMFIVYGWTAAEPAGDEKPESTSSPLFLIPPFILTPLAALAMVEGGTGIMENQYFLSICFTAAAMISVIPAFVSVIRHRRARMSSETAAVCIILFGIYVMAASFALPLVRFI